MSLHTGDEAAIIGLGVGVILTVGAGIFKASTLRGDINSRWTRRVSFAIVALDEKTISELEQLRDDVDDVLPGGHGFAPAQAIANPAPLSARAETTVKYYRARTRMERDFHLLRRLCPSLVVALAAVELAALILTLFYAELVTWGWLRPCGLILLAGAAAALVVATCVYVVLQHRLASAEILAGTGGQAVTQGEEDGE